VLGVQAKAGLRWRGVLEGQCGAGLMAQAGEGACEHRLEMEDSRRCGLDGMGRERCV